MADSEYSTDLFLNAIRPKIFVMKLLILVFFLHFILFPIDARLKKFVTDLHPKSICAIKLLRLKLKKCVMNCLAALKFILDWIFASKMFEKFHDDLFTNDDLLFFYEEFSKVTFFANEMDILGADLDKIILEDDDNFMKMILILLFMSDFWLGIINLKNAKHIKKI